MGCIIHGMDYPRDTPSLRHIIHGTHHPYIPPKSHERTKKRAPRGSLGPVAPKQGLGNKAAGCGGAGAARWYELQRISRVFMEHYVP